MALLPPNACDTHVHVLDPERFAYRPQRAYTPPPATVPALQSFHRTIGCTRTVIVQNSVYGTDNRALLDALQRLGPSARGIATIDKETRPRELEALAGRGVTGIRINLSVSNNADADPIINRVDRADQLPPNWVIAINAGAPTLAAAAPALLKTRRRIVLDHFGHLTPSMIGTAEFSAIVQLLRSGNTFLKFSGPYQVSSVADYSDLRPLVLALLYAAPGQFIWGSDWPHTGGTKRDPNADPNRIEPFRIFDDRAALAQLLGWIPDAAQRRRIFVETPAALFGFDQDRVKG